MTALAACKKSLARCVDKMPSHGMQARLHKRGMQSKGLAKCEKLASVGDVSSAFPTRNETLLDTRLPAAPHDRTPLKAAPVELTNAEGCEAAQENEGKAESRGRNDNFKE
eukprot:CAMPEP_0176239618 /NCGR_PEP_ID=MMETSP0121_2-20121125/28959_1 /TAXON_ID=160619 /ORGANISM="Kryptoperidinium foliaceum, Strain CCMP 1326" /LENGTH=109 /DNA_ID=CAMNT_0017579101 /DNA_START=42 /DNA_END=373 /DNA_ORIENTATION=+